MSLAASRVVPPALLRDTLVWFGTFLLVFLVVTASLTVFRSVRRAALDRRLEALSWLALLDVPVDIDALSRRASGPDERAAVARICYERAVLDANALGTELLLRTAAPLSLLGLDTLYRLNEADPQALLEAGAAERED